MYTLSNNQYSFSITELWQRARIREIVEVGYVIFELYMYDQKDFELWNHAKQSLAYLPALRSLVDLFEHIGNTPGQIRRFTATEDARGQKAFHSHVYRYWRAFMHGDTRYSSDADLAISRSQSLHIQFPDDEE